MANNGIFYSSGNTLNFTTNSTTWATLTSGGTFIINTVSGGTYLNLTGGTTSGAYLPLSGGTMTGGIVANSGLTATTVSATTYLNLPQSVSGTGTQDYVTKWDSSTSGITDSEIYSTSGFIGLFTSVPVYNGEIVSMSTSNKGISIDGLYLREDGNGSIAMAVGFDYSTWTSGGNEIAIGNGTPLSNSGGIYNIAIGNRSLLANTIGSNNVSIGGSHTLVNNITGSSNVAIGLNSLYNNTIGNYNIAIGEGTGFANSGSSNVYLGYASGYNNDGNNNIFIGYTAGYGDTSSSNKLNIGDTIIGDLSTKSIRVPTISATTYDNLPGSSSSNCYTTFYVTNISGCSPVNILTPLNLTEGINVTGITNFTNTVGFSGGLTASTVSATTYQNLPISGLTQGSNVTITNNGNGNYTISSTGGGGGLSGSGTSNYLPKWTGTTGLGNSQIQDNGNYLAIGITPSSGVKFWIYTTSASTYGIRGDGTSGGVYGQGVGSGYGVYGNANSSIGVVGSSVGDSGTNIGVYGSADVNDAGSPTNIGGHFFAQNGGSNYSVHLQDGTEGVNKVLISTTSDGKANWSNVLTGLTNVRSATISATTYQGNVVTQITAGSGISIDQSTGNVTITATGGGGGGLTFQQVQMVAFLSS